MRAGAARKFKSEYLIQADHPEVPQCPNMIEHMVDVNYSSNELKMSDPAYVLHLLNKVP